MNILLMPAAAVMIAAAPVTHDQGFGKLAEICLAGSLERAPGISADALRADLSSCLNTPEAMEAIDLENGLPSCRQAGSAAAIAHCIVSR